MQITAQVSLFPTETADADQVIMQSIENTITANGLDYEVGPVSTQISGTPEDVWKALRNMYEEAAVQGGEVAMSITVSNGRR